MAKRTTSSTRTVSIPAVRSAFDANMLMQRAVEVMLQSQAEPRTDGKVSPKVGAVLYKPDGTIETASRGELRLGDHAEFTLLERKNRAEKLDDCILFATLEPCAPGSRRHPKLGCAERIVNARIKEVWIGIEDPDPTVDRKGIKYLEDNGVKVTMFPPGYQKQIREANKDFLKQAIQRAHDHAEKKPITLSPLEAVVPTARLNQFSEKAIRHYLSKAKLDFKYNSPELWEHFEYAGWVERINKGAKDEYVPTGFGVLLFGSNVRDKYPQAAVKAKVKYGQRASQPKTFEGPLVLIPDEIENWLNQVLNSEISRQKFERKTEHAFPIEPLREAVINALAHRDYAVEGAKTVIEIDDDKIVVKSAGLPVSPITLEQVKAFEAPSLSRNPKITFVFNQMGLMEESELGMETFRTIQERHNLPLPEYDYQAPYLTLTFSRSIAAVKKVSNNKAIRELSTEEIRGYEWIKSMKEVSTKQYAERFGYTQRTATRHLSAMLKAGIITTNGVSIKSPRLKYKAL
jgi:ATP-dependent DNA helicase RecG